MTDNFISFLLKAGITGVEIKSLQPGEVKDGAFTHAGPYRWNDTTNKKFIDGSFSLSNNELDELEKLGEKIISKAKEMKVDLTKYPEIKAAMAFDKDPTKLSAAELGAFMGGLAMQERTKSYDGVFTNLLKSFGIGEERTQTELSRGKNALPDAATDTAVKIGQQIYGDNKTDSSVDTGPSAKNGNWGNVERPKM